MGLHLGEGGRRRVDHARVGVDGRLKRPEVQHVVVGHGQLDEPQAHEVACLVDRRVGRHARHHLRAGDAARQGPVAVRLCGEYDGLGASARHRPAHVGVAPADEVSHPLDNLRLELDGGWPDVRVKRVANARGSVALVQERQMFCPSVVHRAAHPTILPRFVLFGREGLDHGFDLTRGQAFLGHGRPSIAPRRTHLPKQIGLHLRDLFVDFGLQDPSEPRGTGGDFHGDGHGGFLQSFGGTLEAPPG
mmetsp:Transcript_31855/g.71706  ORF Transcript_31855/g.71706 Transcript_31855/m.71706 type:complete len:247 (-) Transcript_31855:555-1295(-)